MEKLFKSVFIVIALFFIALVLISANVFGSSVALIKIEQTTGDTVKAKIGTYQIIQTLKVPEAYTNEFMNELLVKIEAMRDENKEVIFKLSDYSYVRVLPKNIINAPGFVPIEEIVVECKSTDK